MGRIGTLPTIMTMYKFAEYVKQAFTVEHVRLVCQDRAIRCIRLRYVPDAA